MIHSLFTTCEPAFFLEFHTRSVDGWDWHGVVDTQELRLILHGQVVWRGRLRGPHLRSCIFWGLLGTEGLAMVMEGSFGSSDEYVYYEALLIWTR